MSNTKVKKGLIKHQECKVDTICASFENPINFLKKKMPIKKGTCGNSS